MNSTFENIRRFLVFFTAAFALMYLAYSAAATVTYIRHDSVRYFHKFYNKDSDAPINPQYRWLKALGRPIAAEEEEFLYKNINNLSDILKLRFATIVIFALSAALLASIVVSMGIREIPAFCISTAIFTLPGVQESIFVPYLFIGLSLLLSLIAYAIWKSRLMWGARIVLAFILLEVSFFTYVPSAFFFLLPAAFMVVLKEGDWKNTQKQWTWDLLFGCLAGLFYILVIKFFFYQNVELSGHYITGLSVLSNIKRFFPEAVPQTFNLWNIYYSKPFGIFLGLFVSMILIIHAILQRKAEAWQRLLSIAGSFLIFNMVWIMLGGYLPRTFIASQAMAVLLLYWCAGLLRFQAIGAVVIMIIGLIFANITTNYNVWNSNAELMFIRSRLAQYADTTTKEIHIIRPKDQNKGYNGLSASYDNFNEESTSEFEVPDLIRVALKDMDKPPIEMHCIVTTSNDGEPYNIDPQTLVIDLNDLVRISRDHFQ